MVISHILGGLGNQLFQYAAGRCVAVRNRSQLLLDLSDFNQYRIRNFDLDFFDVNYSVATSEDVHRLKPSGNLLKAAQLFVPKKFRSYHRERSFNYSKSILKAPGNVYLKGYFQSEKYFLPIENIIRREFTIKPTHVRDVQSYAPELCRRGSVGVHVRRGDYANKDVQTVLSTVEADYYNRAIGYVESKIENPRFYVFSDDIEWVKHNLDIPHATFVSGDISKNHIEDFYLLSQCANQIIPNSTFAWWAAWLNTNKEKLVIAPKKWFNHQPSNRDRTPPAWQRI